MVNRYYLHPPLVVRVGAGHWRPPQPVTLETETRDHAGGMRSYGEFRLLMDDVVLYQGGGYGVERFGDYVSPTSGPPEIRLDPSVLF
jgi:hypothetical protein